MQDISLNIRIFEYIILNFVFEFIFVTVIGPIIAALSAFMSQLAAIIISACMFILPSALYMINIYSVKAISVSFCLILIPLILDKGISLNSFIPHFVLILICIGLLWLMSKKMVFNEGR